MKRSVRFFFLPANAFEIIHIRRTNSSSALTMCRNIGRRSFVVPRNCSDCFFNYSMMPYRDVPFPLLMSKDTRCNFNHEYSFSFTVQLRLDTFVNVLKDFRVTIAKCPLMIALGNPPTNSVQIHTQFVMLATESKQIYSTTR